MGIYDRDYYQEDELRPLRPWDNRSMVTLLIIANVAVYVANFLFTNGNNALVDFITLEARDLTRPLMWWHYVSYGFAHNPAGIGHILFNMVSLYFLGRSVEERLGKWEFFRFYLVTLTLCGVIYSLLHYSDGGAVIGASGATTAVAMLFVFFFPQATLMLYGVIPVKAWVLGILIIILNLFQPSSPRPGQPQVAYDIHLTGAALAAVYFFAKLDFGFWRRWTTGVGKRIKQKRSGLKIHQPSKREAPQPSKDDLESDRILDKIYRQGEESLTAAERKFMEDYSRKVRNRRGS